MQDFLWYVSTCLINLSRSSFLWKIAIHRQLSCESVIKSIVEKIQRSGSVDFVKPQCSNNTGTEAIWSFKTQYLCHLNNLMIFSVNSDVKHFHISGYVNVHNYLLFSVCYRQMVELINHNYAKISAIMLTKNCKKYSFGWNFFRIWFHMW